MNDPKAEPRLRLFVRQDKKQIAVFFKNETALPFRGTVGYLVEQPDGVRRGETSDPVLAPAQSETQLIFFDRREIREKKELLRLFLFDEAGNELYRTCWQSEKLRRRLRDPQLQTTVFLRAGTVCVTVKAARFAPDVILRCDGCTFSENGFTLFAGEEKTVEVHSAKADFAGAVSVTSAFDRR